MRKILLGVSFLLSVAGHTQPNTVDSLQTLLQTAAEDTSKVNLLIAVGKQFRYSNTDTALYFARTALNLATRLNYQMGIADSKRGISALSASQGKFDEGVKYGNEALAIYNKLNLSATSAEKVKILARIGGTYQVIGHNRVSQGNYPEGLRNTLLSLRIQEELGDKPGISSVRFNLGNIYSLQHNYPEALRNYYASVKISEELGFKSDIATTYSAIGWLYIQQGNYPEATKSCFAALKLAEEAKNDAALAEIYNNLGLIYNQREDYDEALKYDFAALRIYQESGIDQQLPDIYNNIGLVYMKQKKYDNAFHYFDKALSFAKKINSLELIKWSYENLAALDSTQGNYKKALEDYKFVFAYRDSLFNEENAKKLVQQQMQYDFDKKENAIKAAQDKRDIITAAAIKNGKLVRNFSFAGTFAILSFGGYGFYRFRKRKKLQGQQTLMNERLRISRELHDEIGATLSGIAMYSHLTKEQIKNSQINEVEKSLNIMQQSSGEMVNKLNDIVWLINPDQDSLQKLIQRLEEYARDMAAIKNMHVHVTMPAHLHEYVLPVESRRNIYLFCKEAINNAVKYSEGTLLDVSIKQEDNKLDFSVSDNGKGFDTFTVRRGNGLENMQRRADEIGANLLLKSEKGEGALVCMQLKIT
ncbi:MAG TPA: tetratricopeptide repeat protein [Parafilimonas sp.]|nr:tetratricopeptide repeat protein [Parafilimonas sp.]